jgi:hypothetical protein
MERRGLPWNLINPDDGYLLSAINPPLDYLVTISIAFAFSKNKSN